MEFLFDSKKEYCFLLRFESHDLIHTIVEISFDGLYYRFPKNLIIEWLSTHNIYWKWCCKKTEIWRGEPHRLGLVISENPPMISFKNKNDALFFKLTWDNQ